SEPAAAPSVPSRASPWCGLLAMSHRVNRGRTTELRMAPMRPLRWACSGGGLLGEEGMEFRQEAVVCLQLRPVPAVGDGDEVGVGHEGGRSAGPLLGDEGVEVAVEEHGRGGDGRETSDMTSLRWPRRPTVAWL